jgi:hypothetical protein
MSIVAQGVTIHTAEGDVDLASGLVFGFKSGGEFIAILLNVTAESMAEIGANGVFQIMHSMYELGAHHAMGNEVGVEGDPVSLGEIMEAMDAGDPVPEEKSKDPKQGGAIE